MIKLSFKTAFLYLCLTACCTLLIMSLVLQRTTITERPVDHDIQLKYAIYTDGCKIPEFNPFDNSLKGIVWKEPQLFCERNFKKPLVYQDGNWLRINNTLLADGNFTLDYCAYSVIMRRPNNDQTIRTSIKIRFKTDIQILSDTEFVKVECFANEANETLYLNYFAFIVPRKKSQNRSTDEDSIASHTNGTDKHLNVILLGVDSVSRLNGIRQLPKTRKYLLKNLNAFEMLGYNKVADNTFFNLVPMLSGKYAPELPYDEKSMKKKYFDEYDFMWKKYGNLGYTTLFAEDAPYGALFNYLKAGFKHPPTDYYLRPFSLAIEVEKSLWHNDHDCFGGRLETKIVLDWLSDFISASTETPYFALTFISRLSHDLINRLGAADEVYFRFFESLKDQGRLENTAVFFFGDHGMRFGNIRNTYIGKMEERLPMMYVYFPEWFKKKYQHITENLYSNSRALTTPFDIYETLTDILYLNLTTRMTPAVVTERGMSLFKKIPPERTCNHTTILPHWCTCHTQIKISTETEIIKKVADVTLSYLNKQTMPYRSRCVELSIFTINNAYSTILEQELSADEYKIQNIVDYQITITTVPGEGQFEATVSHFAVDGRFVVTGDVSRINLYGTQSHCIDNFVLKKYCYCK